MPSDGPLCYISVMRLAIVENDPLMLKNLSTLFSTEREISVVGTYASAEETLHSLSVSSPEIMIVDLGLPDRSWLGLIEQAKRTLPGLDIMAHSLFEETETLLSAIHAGASGYLMKGTGADAMIDAIRGLHTGRASMSTKVAQRLLEIEKQNREVMSALNGTQRAVVSLKAEGLTSREIADRSGLSLHDVGACFKSIYTERQIRNWQ